jgi:hypothetical protein
MTAAVEGFGRPYGVASLPHLAGGIYFYCLRGFLDPKSFPYNSSR